MIWWCIYCIYTTRKKKSFTFKANFKKGVQCLNKSAATVLIFTFLLVTCEWIVTWGEKWDLIRLYSVATSLWLIRLRCSVLLGFFVKDSGQTVQRVPRLQGAAAANVSREVKPANKLTTRHRSSSEPLQVSVSCTPLQIKHLSRFLHTTKSSITQNKGIENISPACGLIWTEAVVNTYLYN